MASYVHLNMDQGANFTYTLVLNDASTNANLNISSYTITSQIRKSYYSVNATANLVCTTTDAANGAFTISLNGAGTANISGGKYLFDILYSDGTGTLTRALEGTIQVNPRVTR